jgi:hypothetical protein
MTVNHSAKTVRASEANIHPWVMAALMVDLTLDLHVDHDQVDHS